MKILITGGAGYIGSVITNLALNAGHEVKAVDVLWFNKQIPLVHYNNPAYQFIKADICNTAITESLVSDVDFIVHTAAVVGDPASKLFPELTRQINYDATINLINKAEEKGVKGFVFFSTCSNYGISDGMATEESALNPLSLYAETKVDVERYLMDKVKNLDWVIGRLSTVYGISPRMRFDLTVNDFALNAFKKKYLDIFLPKSYRPYIHVFDLAKVVLKIIDNFPTVKNNVFNIGFMGENYQKIQIADAVCQYIDGVKIDILKEGGDMRDYQVDFGKLKKYLNLKNVYNVDSGLKQIIEILNSGLISDPDLNVYYNTKPDLL